MRALVILACLAAAPVSAAGDPERGKALHAACLSCHGTELYVPPRRKITSYPALVKEVARWNRSYNPKFSQAELDDLVAYLDRDFYRLK